MFSVSEFPVDKEYEKNKDIKPSDIQSLREWLNMQPHLPQQHITDLDLILAYYSCNRNIEVTREVIDLNFTLRTILTFYQNREINKCLEAALNTWLVVPLATTTIQGYRAIYCHLLDPEPKHFIYADVVKAFVMVMDLWQYEEGTVPGVAVIINMDKVTLGHISRIDISVAQQFFFFLQEAMFVRVKEFHFINAPGFIDKLLLMVKPFMKKEMLDMLKVHQVGSSTLDEYIPRTALPSEDVKASQAIELKDKNWNKIKANMDFFKEESKKRVDESKRPGQRKTMSTFFSGLEETFKKLEID